jgi:hypothetical protein
MMAYETDPLDEMEDVVGVFYGSRGQVGSQYVVTNRRLLIGPLNVKIAADIDAYVLDAAVPGGGSLLKSVLTHYAPMNPKTVWLRHVVDVRPTNDARLEISTDTEEAINLSFVSTPPGKGGLFNMGSFTWDPRNRQARDRAVRVIANAVRAAKTAPPRG